MEKDDKFITKPRKQEDKIYFFGVHIKKITRWQIVFLVVYPVSSITLFSIIEFYLDHEGYLDYLWTDYLWVGIANIVWTFILLFFYKLRWNR